MAEPSSILTIRAAVEAILPGDGALPAGPDLAVHEHVIAMADQYLAGFADVIAALLDAYAFESAGAPFADLDVPARIAALRALASEPAVDVRDAADALFAFAYGGMYSEWTGYDRGSRRLAPPAAWARIGFHGPSLGHPEFAERPAGPHPDSRVVGEESP